MLYKGRLQANDSNAGPARVLFFDTETVETVEPGDRLGSTLKLRLGYAIAGRLRSGKFSGRKDFAFFDSLDFWDFVFRFGRRRETTWVFAHNLIFDLVSTKFWELWEQGIIREDVPRAPRRETTTKSGINSGNAFIVLNDPPTILVMRHIATGARFIFVDSLNWLPMPLREIGKRCGIPKGELPKDSDSVGTWLEYCKTDVEILVKTFVELFSWLRKHDLGVIKYTAPMQSMQAYRHRFMPIEEEYYTTETRNGKLRKRLRKLGLIDMGHSLDIKIMERDSYYGGRVECFRIGNIPEECFYLDVTSLYPSVMLTGQFPYKLDKSNMQVGITRLAPEMDYTRSVAEVYIESSDETYPWRTDKVMIYCTGSFWTTLAGADLSRAVINGHVKGWGRWAQYRTARIFTKYVKELWELRKGYLESGDDLYSEFVKLLLNSLYGKFGQRNPKWIDRPDLIAPSSWIKWVNYDMSTGIDHVFRSVGWLAQQKVDPPEREGSFPAVCAFVTAMARRRMRLLRSLAGDENVYYQAVDGILVNGQGFQNLSDADEIASSELGKLKIEAYGTDVKIEGCNRWRINGKWRVAGRKSGATVHDDGSWTERCFSGVNALFHGAPACEIHITEVLKKWHGGYVKGSLQPDGRIQPLALTEPFV